MLPLSLIPTLSIILSISCVYSVNSDIATLTASQWKDQISLNDENSQHTWVYLTGQESCQDGEACEIFHNVISQKYKSVQTKSLSHRVFMLDCDADAILCYSWLLTPPALMHFTIIQTLSHSPLQHPVLHQRAIMRPIQLSLSAHPNDTAVAQIASLLDNTDIETIDIWDGFLNPFTGALGKYGGGVVWGYVKRHLEWLPASQQTLMIGTLMGVRVLIARYGRAKPIMTAADRVVPPGSIG